MHSKHTLTSTARVGGLIAVAIILCLTPLSPARADQPEGARRGPVSSDAAGVESLPYLAPAQPQAPEDAPALSGAYASWSKIAFQSGRDQNWEVYLADGDGANQTRLTSDPAADTAPRLNRGATRLAFASKRGGAYDIYTMNLDGSALAQLTSNAADNVNPAWSADGSRIAFQSYRDGQSEIYVMRADGRDVRRLTNSADYDGEPSWSPDGSRLAFVSRRSASYRVYVMWSDGSGPAMFSNQPYSGHPVWSPDGRQIAYEADGDRDGWLELWLMNADGSNQRQVFEAAQPQTDVWAGGWSPDGRFVTITRISYVNQNNTWYWTRAYLDAWDTATGGILRLSSQGMDWYPDWQTVDVTPPTTDMAPLPAQSAYAFAVAWSAVDSGGAGVAAYDVQVSDNGGAWQDWKLGTQDTAAVFTGIGGHTYSFRCRARDGSLNYSAFPEHAQALTTVEALPPLTTMQPLAPFTRGGDFDISWSGVDPGGSGIKSYDVQYDDGSGAGWQMWATGVTATHMQFNGAPGYTYRLHVRGIDRAGNVQPWAADGSDASTTTYRWMVSGTVKDVRDNPVTGAVTAVQPPAVVSLASDEAGAYTAYVGPARPTYSVSWSRSAYGRLPAVELSGDGDQQFSVWLPPADNLMRNGDFESGSTALGWRATGDIAPAITEKSQHSGWQSAVVGQPVELSPVVRLSIGSPYWSYPDHSYPASLVVDGVGTVHLLWMEKLSPDTILYAQQPAGGAWSAPLALSTPAGWGSSPQLAVDSRRTVHAVWGQSEQIMYASKPEQGSWSAVAQIPGATGRGPSIVADTEDTVYVIWAGPYGSRSHVAVYAAQPLGGTWSAPEPIRSGGQIDDAGATTAAAVDGAGGVHAVWTGYNSTALSYAGKPLHGSWSTPMAPSAAPAWDPSIAVDGEGTVHIVWWRYGANLVYYINKPAGGAWSTPEADRPRMVVGAGHCCQRKGCRRCLEQI